MSATHTVNGLDQVTGRALGARGYGVSGAVAPEARVKVYHPQEPEGEEITVNPTTGAYEAFWSVSGDWNGGGVTRVEMTVRGTLEGGGSAGRDAVADQLVWVVVPAAGETIDYVGGRQN